MQSAHSQKAARPRPGFNFVTKSSQIFLDNRSVLDYGRRASEAFVDRGLSIANRERFFGLPQVAGATEGGNH
jgi:hypothetical protein